MIKPVFFVIVCAIVLSAACKKQSFLAPVVVTDLTEETVFADSARTMDFLANIYTGVDLSFDDRRFGDRTNLSAACDEAEGSRNITDNTYLQFATGNVNPSNVNGEIYARPWVYIRAVNQLLKHLPEAKFSQSQKNRVKGEALFLRAWYYAMMLKHYGGIPIIGDTIYKPSDVISTKRKSYEECVNYVVSQCNEAQKLLGISYNQLDFGRATIGACLGLKSRVLLYAASPLFNDNKSIPGQTPMDLTGNAEIKKMVGYTTYSAERWKRAADVTDTLLKSGAYKLNVDNTAPGIGFYRTFLNKLNPEFIFFRIDGTTSLEATFGPPSTGGLADLQGTYPYQDLVDAFDMINGKPADGTNPVYNPNEPYANRDPRFNYTICHNLSRKMDYNGTASLGFKSILTYVGAGLDAVHSGTATGYYVNKMLRDSSAGKNFLSGPSRRAFPLIRYAEMLLNYAEAINEYEGPDKAYPQLIELRKRASILPGSDNNYGLKQNMSKNEMRAAIQHERRIELAFEEHRFWDVRRWKIAEETENKLMSGMEVILQKPANKYVYQKFSLRQHTFHVKNYLWPFPQREISKNSTNPDIRLDQNPGY